MKQFQKNSYSYRKKHPKEISPKVLKAIYLEMSKDSLDLSKLTFGGIILTMITNADMNRIITFAIGCISIIVLTIIGFVLYKKGKE